MGEFKDEGIKWAKRDDKLVLEFVNKGVKYQVDFDANRFIVDVRWWSSPDQLIAGFGDVQSWMADDFSKMKRVDVHKDMERCQAQLLREHGMGFEWLTEEEGKTAVSDFKKILKEIS